MNSQIISNLMDKINNMLKDKKKKQLQLLEPLSTIIRLAILYFVFFSSLIPQKYSKGTLIDDFITEHIKKIKSLSECLYFLLSQSKFDDISSKL